MPAESETVVDEIGLKVTLFEQSVRMSPYITAICAGPYFGVHEEHDGIDLGLYCRQSMKDYLDPEGVFEVTRQGFDHFHEHFGVRYPLPKYDHVFVPDSHFAGMENYGCVVVSDSAYMYRGQTTAYDLSRRAIMVLHEMAHMWFGDLVTMRWWDDLWLNESFATWASVLAQVGATQYDHAWTTFASVEKSWAYRQDQLPSTHPVAADIQDLQAVEVNFDGITYAKGASVLKQLVAYVGLDNFLAGLRIYFNRHAWGNATLDDLLQALEEASGRDLSWWSAQWLETTGLNMLRPRFAIDGEGRFTSFEVVQNGARPGAGELRTHRLAIGIYDDEGGKLVRKHRVELDVTGERTEVPDLVGVHRGKLVLVNDDDLTYCSLRFDPESLATLIDRIGDIEESLPRALCWSTAWEMTREAELKARDFVTLVLGTSADGGIGAESEIGVVQRVLLQTQTALASYVDPSWQAEGWRRFAGRLFELARGAEPGSDHQLAFVNSVAGSVLSDEQVAELRGWLDGSAPLAGLSVDTDLRWQLLQALVAHGAADEAEIDAELEKDQTATGRRRAERARALIPTPESKEKAWQRAVHDDQLPNAVSDAIIAGFQHPAQRELLVPYVRRYFEEIDEVWQRRSSERAQPTVIGLFPSWAVADDTVTAADAWLAGEHPSALRRLVSEGRAGIVRALAAREFDRS
jgi:aminopeptidase N